jgi:hypothetical protein
MMHHREKKQRRPHRARGTPTAQPTGVGPFAPRPPLYFADVADVGTLDEINNESSKYSTR